MEKFIIDLDKWKKKSENGVESMVAKENQWYHVLIDEQLLDEIKKKMPTVVKSDN